MLLSMYRCLAGITNTPVMKLFYVKRTYPFIRECGDFYEDYIQNRYGNSTDIRLPPGDMKTQLGPESAVGCGFCGTDIPAHNARLWPNPEHDADRQGKWQDIVDHLPAYKVIMPTRRANQGLPVYAKNEAGWDALRSHDTVTCRLSM